MHVCRVDVSCVQVYLPFYKSLMITDKGRFNELVERVLGWRAERIIPCHGSIVEGRDACEAEIRRQTGLTD